jgi:hypothetical protein
VLIATLIPNPLAAIPLAIVLHFVLDALPHFDFLGGTNNPRIFSRMLGIDITLALVVLVTILIFRPAHWPLLIACGVACASPDLMWLPKYYRTLKEQPAHALNALQKFHKNIQWCERPWGLGIEALWAATVTFVLWQP